jgi:hypothetical protein
MKTTSTFQYLFCFVGIAGAAHAKVGKTVPPKEEPVTTLTRLEPCDQAYLIKATTPVNSGELAASCLSDAGVKDMKTFFESVLSSSQQSKFMDSENCKSWYSDYTEVLANLNPCAMENGADIRVTGSVPFDKFLKEKQKDSSSSESTLESNAASSSGDSSQATTSSGSSTDSPGSLSGNENPKKKKTNETLDEESSAASLTVVTALITGVAMYLL